MGTALTALRASIETLESKLPDSEFGFDIKPYKDIAVEIYNVFNDHEKRIAALESQVQLPRAPIQALE